jgi:uncharacterized protein (TIGR02231 family)
MELTAPIVHVTVYLDRARIERRGSAPLEAGTHALTIGGLPLALDRDAVRASGNGPAGTRIERIDIAPEYNAEAPEAEIRALKEALEQLEHQEKLLQARRQALQNQRTWLNKLGDQAATDMARGLAFSRIQPEDCGTFFTFASDQARSLDETELDLAEQHAKLERDIQARQRELNQLRGSRSADRLAAVVEVTLPTAGDFTLELSYVLAGAWWTPQYDVRVDTEQRQVELTYQGMVTQNTGEDWKQVGLSLSTARPSSVTRVPDLDPWYLHVPIAFPVAAPKGRSVALLRTARMPQGFGGGLPAPAPMQSDFVDQITEQEVLAGLPEEKQVAAEVSRASVEQTGGALLFHAGRSADVPSDGSPHAITIARDDLSCAFDYVTAPTQEEVAHLRATITNTTERVLLPGKAHIFHGDSYMGFVALEKIAPREEFKLFVGIDDAIRVKRELREKDVDKGSLLQSSIRRMTYTYRTQLRNYRATPERITLRDRLPVPQHERIKVRVLEIRPEPDERTKLDLLTWEFTLPPNEERTFEVRFSVEHPRDLVVKGLP